MDPKVEYTNRVKGLNTSIHGLGKHIVKSTCYKLGVTDPSIIEKVSSEILNPFSGQLKPVKDTNRPKRPVSAYILFTNDYRAEIKAQNPGASTTDIMRALAAAWNKKDAAFKAKYELLKEESEKKYLVKLEEYKNSLATGIGMSNEPSVTGYKSEVGHKDTADATSAPSDKSENPKMKNKTELPTKEKKRK